eukprot:gene17167-17360_t
MDTHIPVLLREVVETLSPKDSGIYIDATFGGGGYTRALLEAKNCKVIGIDRDPDAAIRAKSFKNEFKDRFEFISGVFSELDTLLPQNQTYDGIVFDFEWAHLNDPSRLQVLAQKYLDIAPIGSTQYVSFEDVASKDGGYDRKALEDLIAQAAADPIPFSPDVD